MFPSDPNLFPSQVVARNFIFLDATTGDFNSNLPLLIISTEGRRIIQNIPPGGARTNGSLVVMYPSQMATAPWGASAEVYLPPQRNFNLDVNFKDPAKLFAK